MRSGGWPAARRSIVRRASWRSIISERGITAQAVSTSRSIASSGVLIYNIGYLCLQRGDREGARAWWTRLLDSSDEAERRQAVQLLRELDGDTPEQ